MVGDLGEEVRPADATKASQLEAKRDLEGWSEGRRNRNLQN